MYRYHSFIVQFSLSRMAKPRRFMPEPMLCLAERGIDDDDDDDDDEKDRNMGPLGFPGFHERLDIAGSQKESK